MKIQYKFNKSSEARDCVVESVELYIKEQTNYDIVPLSKEELIEVLLKNDYNSSEEAKFKFIEESKPSDNTWSYGYDITSIVQCAFTYLKINSEFNTTKNTTYDLQKGTETGEVYVLLNDEDKDINIYGEATYSYYNVTELDNIKAERIVNKKTVEAQSLKFISLQQLKDYINTIQESIEFIAESSIDDVLMKEWLGEWKYTFDCIGCNNTNYWLECEDTLRCKWKKDYIGSPKLNSNWTFKIE